MRPSARQSSSASREDGTAAELLGKEILVDPAIRATAAWVLVRSPGARRPVHYRRLLEMLAIEPIRHKFSYRTARAREITARWAR